MAGASVGELFHDYTYAYNDTNGTMTSLLISAEGDGIGDNDDYAVSDTMTYAYDALQRLASQTVKKSGQIILTKEYSYKNLSGGRTTQQIIRFTVRAGNTVLDSYTIRMTASAISR